MLWNRGHPPSTLPLHSPAQARCMAPSGSIWLHLIEGFWKILRQRALAGRVCSTTVEVDQALQAGVADWNQRPTPFLWNRPPKPKRFLTRGFVYRV